MEGLGSRQYFKASFCIYLHIGYSTLHTPTHIYSLLAISLPATTITIHTSTIYLDSDRCEGKTTNPQCISPMQLNRIWTKREAAVEGQAAERQNERWGLVKREKRERRALVG